MKKSTKRTSASSLKVARAPKKGSALPLATRVNPPRVEAILPPSTLGTKEKKEPGFEYWDFDAWRVVRELVNTGPKCLDIIMREIYEMDGTEDRSYRHYLRTPSPEEGELPFSESRASFCELLRLIDNVDRQFHENAKVFREAVQSSYDAGRLQFLERPSKKNEAAE